MKMIIEKTMFIFTRENGLKGKKIPSYESPVFTRFQSFRKYEGNNVVLLRNVVMVQF